MKKATIIFIIVVVCLALTIGNLKKYNYADGDEYSAGGARISDEVKDVEINWVDGKVNVITYDGDEIILSEEADRNLSEKKKLHWQLDGKTLRVQYARSGSFRISNMKKELTVKLPKTLTLDDLKIIVVSADVEAGNIDADELKIVTVSGEVKAACKDLTKVDAVTVSGDLNLQFVRAPEKIGAESVSGNVKISLPEDAGFKAEMDSVSGEVKGAFAMVRKGDDLYVYGDERCSIDVNTVSGNLILDKMK